MKLQIAFDLIDLDAALELADKVAPYADILEVGTLLIYKHGNLAVKKFSQTFGQHVILADTKINDRGADVVTIFSDAGTHWLTIMAGSHPDIIRATCTAAHNLSKKVMADLSDASSLGQSALEAESFGIDALMFHLPRNSSEFDFNESWEMVRGNTKLPIYVSVHSYKPIEDIIKLKPDGIIVSHAILDAQDPVEKARYFSELCKSVI